MKLRVLATALLKARPPTTTDLYIGSACSATSVALARHGSCQVHQQLPCFGQGFAGLC